MRDVWNNCEKYCIHKEEKEFDRKWLKNNLL